MEKCMKKYIDNFIEEHITSLEKCGLFQDIETKDISVMLKCLNAKAISYQKDDFVFREGQKATNIGVVLSGCVQIVKEDYYGNRNILSRMTESETFGESFACAHTDSLPVNVIASENSTILFLNCERIISTCPNACVFHRQIIYNLLQLVASKNLAFQKKIEITSKRTTREKLMTYLTMQARQHQSSSFTIPYNRQELADYLEVERSAMSAEISKMKKDKIIDCNRYDFKIL